jgi:hypothetical protein
MCRADRNNCARHRPDRYTHKVSRFPMATSGPKLRAGFIEAPSNGPPMVPQAMM